MDKDLAVVLRELEKLNEPHGGTVTAHSRALGKIRNRLDNIHRRRYHIEQRLECPGPAESTRLQEGVQLADGADPGTQEEGAGQERALVGSYNPSHHESS